MGFWSSLFGRPSPRIRKDPILVRVVLHELHEAREPGAKEYLYEWPLPEDPEVGDRVLVPAAGERKHGTVSGPGSRRDYSGNLSAVIAVIPAAEVARATRAWASAHATWLDLARAKAGLPTDGRPLNPPDGFPSIPPPVGNAGDPSAGQHGRVWWRLYKDARTPEEAARFEAIAREWFKIQDDASHDTAVAKLRLEQPSGLVRGRHYTEWVETVKELKRDQRNEEAVELLRELQAATLRVDGKRPAPWYFEQEAIILRKQRCLEAELAVIQRYLQRAEEPAPKLLVREARVRELLAER